MEVPRDAGNPRYGRVGLVALPYYWAFELFAPLLELAGLVLVVLGLALGVVNLSYAYVFLAVAYGYAILVTLAAMTVEELSFHKYDRWRDLRLDPRRLDLGERRLPPAHGVVAARGLVGRAHRQEAGLGHDDPSGLRRHGAGRRRARADRVARSRSPGRLAWLAPGRSAGGSTAWSG